MIPIKGDGPVLSCKHTDIPTQKQGMMQLITERSALSGACLYIFQSTTFCQCPLTTCARFVSHGPFAQSLSATLLSNQFANLENSKEIQKIKETKSKISTDHGGGGRGAKSCHNCSFSPNSLLLGFYLRNKRAGHTHWPRP